MSGEVNLAHLIVIFSVSIFIVVMILFLTLIHIYRQRINKEREVRMAIYQTQESERSRISGELHDNIGAKLSALKLFSESLKKSDNKPIIIDEIVQITRETITELRTIIINTSGDHILKNGFKTEILKLIERFSISDIRFNLIIDEKFPELKNYLGVNIYRILQELISNSLKHSECTEIKLKLRIKDETYIAIIFSNNGKDYDINKISESGLGLRMIDARVKMFEGTIDRSEKLVIINFPFSENI